MEQQRIENLLHQIHILRLLREIAELANSRLLSIALSFVAECQMQIDNWFMFPRFKKII